VTTRMLRCTACRTYTMKPRCPQCSHRAATPTPPKYSPEDRYGEYRRRLRELVQREQGGS